jgi:hypothetical protein
VGTWHIEQSVSSLGGNMTYIRLYTLQAHPSHLDKGLPTDVIGFPALEGMNDSNGFVRHKDTHLNMLPQFSLPSTLPRHFTHADHDRILSGLFSLTVAVSHLKEYLLILQEGNGGRLMM